MEKIEAVCKLDDALRAFDEAVRDMDVIIQLPKVKFYQEYPDYFRKKDFRSLIEEIIITCKELEEADKQFTRIARFIALNCVEKFETLAGLYKDLGGEFDVE